MPTREKAHTIDELTALLRGSELAVVTNYRGLSVAARSPVRLTPTAAAIACSISGVITFGSAAESSVISHLNERKLSSRTSGS